MYLWIWDSSAISPLMLTYRSNQRCFGDMKRDIRGYPSSAKLVLKKTLMCTPQSGA